MHGQMRGVGENGLYRGAAVDPVGGEAWWELDAVLHRPGTSPAREGCVEPLLACSSVIIPSQSFVISLGSSG
jgi:hypothetical protein